MSSRRLPQLSPDGNSVKIFLTLGFVTIIDLADADLAEFTWTARKSPKSKTAYAYRSFWNSHPRSVTLHRVIMERILERGLLPGEEVDHINCDGCDNRRNNLRVATHAENVRNKTRCLKNPSGFKGVFRHKSGRWLAKIAFEKKQRHLGLFDTPEEAHVAYCKAAVELFGEFARFE